MVKALHISAIAFLLFSPNAMAGPTCEDAEKQFADATKVYIKEGSPAFMEYVLKNGPLEGDKRSLALGQGLRQIESFFGPLQSSSVISKKQLGEKAFYVAVVLEYLNGPAFGVATYYRGSKGVGATSMLIKTEPDAILPKQLLAE